jgi:hypothetical protein
VSGWNDAAWLDTSTWLARFQLPTYAFNPPDRWRGSVDPWGGYSSSEDPEAALAAAMAFLDHPPIRPGPRAVLLRFAERCLPDAMTPGEQRVFRAMRQNALRQLIATSPDYQTC